MHVLVHAYVQDTRVAREDRHVNVEKNAIHHGTVWVGARQIFTSLAFGAVGWVESLKYLTLPRRACKFPNCKYAGFSADLFF